MAMMEFPYPCQELPEEQQEYVRTNFPPMPAYDLVRYDVYGNEFGMPRFPRRFAEKLAARIYNLEVRSDDIWVVSYPKTGTSLTLEMVWLMVNNKTELADSPQLTRCPWLECWAFLNSASLASIGIHHEDEAMCRLLDDSVTYVANMRGRRIIKTHLPLAMLPPGLKDKAKVIYVSRNPKDTAVSLYYYYKGWPSFKGSFEACMAGFERGEHFYGDFFQHLVSGWEARHRDNLKFLWYEEMRADIPATLRSLAAFLGLEVPEARVARLAELLQFERMRQNPHITPTSGVALPGKSTFMRKGIVGDSRNHFDPDTLARWDSWTRQRVLGTGLEDLEVFNSKA